MMFSFFIVQETLYLYDKKRSTGTHKRRSGRKSLLRSAAGRACVRAQVFSSRMETFIWEEIIMLRNIDLDEISDGKLYTAGDLAKVGCQDCEGCCDCCCQMGDTIILDPLDVWQLMQGRGKSFEQLLDESVDLHVQDGVILPNLKMAGEKEQCVYLNEKGRCSIHPFRPGICRLFPLGRFYENGSFRYFLQTKECSRENRTKQKIRKWIDMPEFGRYETFVADWHFFVRRLQDRLMQQSDMEAAQRINRYILQEFYFRGWDAEQNFYDQFSERLKKAQKELA